MDPLPRSLVKDEPCAIDEDYLSAYYTSMILMLSMPPLGRVEDDIDTEIKINCCNAGPFNGACPGIIVYMDRALWKFFMLKKDLNI